MGGGGGIKGDGKSASYSQEEITDVVRDVDEHAHHGEVEAVAEGDQRHGDDVVDDELPEIPAPRLEPRTMTSACCAQNAACTR